MSCCNIGFWTNKGYECPPSNGCWIQDGAGEFIFVPKGIDPQWECPNFGQFRVVACSCCGLDGCCGPKDYGFGGFYEALNYGGPYYGGAFPAKGGCCCPQDVTITPGVCRACPTPTPAQIGTFWK